MTCERALCNDCIITNSDVCASPVSSHIVIINIATIYFVTELSNGNDTLNGDHAVNSLEMKGIPLGMSKSDACVFYNVQNMFTDTYTFILLVHVP